MSKRIIYMFKIILSISFTISLCSSIYATEEETIFNLTTNSVEEGICGPGLSDDSIFGCMKYDKALTLPSLSHTEDSVLNSFGQFNEFVFSFQCHTTGIIANFYFEDESFITILTPKESNAAKNVSFFSKSNQTVVKLIVPAHDEFILLDMPCELKVKSKVAFPHLEAIRTFLYHLLDMQDEILDLKEEVSINRNYESSKRALKKSIRYLKRQRSRATTDSEKSSLTKLIGDQDCRENTHSCGLTLTLEMLDSNCSNNATATECRSIIARTEHHVRSLLEETSTDINQIKTFLTAEKDRLEAINLEYATKVDQLLKEFVE